ncbi:MAG: bifunctional adenosylcobinamide kinase/adenosylcobinamide-phosphate guanylyltransferase [Anaerolineaceae bacterium]|nr:bifunctional adenosylcobinamide kinase/adenosylcobinamide-phosphate guanylyltransferase [Anaerolineaceae bacterium]
MPNQFTFILGGARSGKSTYAQQMAEESGRPVTFAATAIAFDEEMAARIAVHRAERPASWHTLESSRGVGKAIREQAVDGGIVLLDCLTLLANNVLLALPDPQNGPAAQAALDAEVDDLLDAWGQGNADWIVVSNEVGLGLVPEYPLGRVYRDVLGRANQRLARAATRVIFMVAGLPLIVK